MFYNTKNVQKERFCSKIEHFAIQNHLDLLAFASRPIINFSCLKSKIRA